MFFEYIIQLAKLIQFWQTTKVQIPSYDCRLFGTLLYNYLIGSPCSFRGHIKIRWDLIHFQFLFMPLCILSYFSYMADCFQYGNHMSNLCDMQQEVGVVTSISYAKGSLTLDPPHQASLTTVTVRLRRQNCSYKGK